MSKQGYDIIVYDKAAMPSGPHIESVAGDFQFTEGPVWHTGGYLLFSDTPANCIWQLFPDGTKKIFLDQSGLSGTDTSALSDMTGSNGLAIDDKENLLICQHGNHAIARLAQSHLSPLIGEYQGRPFNSPNDLVIRSDGSIYFTDPPYGLKDQVLHPDTFQPLAGVYRYSHGELVLISSRQRYPNGICFSPDEQYLYISSNHPDEPALWRYTVSAAGDISHPMVLIRQNADGIKTDKKGNIFLCTDDGVMIVSPEGKKIALLRLPESPANLAWVKPGYEILYVTARSHIYRIRDLL